MRAALRFVSVCVAVLLSSAFGLARAANEADPSAIGAARVIVADVSAQDNAATRRLAEADPVRFNELIATAANAAAIIVLADETELAMGENAKLRLNEFVLSDGEAARLSLSLAFGAFRFATGDLPKSAYTIRTPSAAIAVRGTVFDLAVDEAGAVYLAVREGGVTVTTNAGERRDVDAGESLDISAAGIADLPRPTPALPAGALPGKLQAMDAALAAHVAEIDVSALADLSVLGPSGALGPRGPAGPEPGVDLGKNKSGKGKSDKGKSGSKF